VLAYDVDFVLSLDAARLGVLGGVCLIRGGDDRVSEVLYPTTIGFITIPLLLKSTALFSWLDGHFVDQQIGCLDITSLVFSRAALVGHLHRTLHLVEPAAMDRGHQRVALLDRLLSLLVFLETGAVHPTHHHLLSLLLLLVIRVFKQDVHFVS
jgi:hypothetical protein